MFDIEFTLPDERSRALVEAYWATAADGSWVHSVAQIERDFAVARGGVPRELNACSIVRLVGFDCSRCGSAPLVTSRANVGDVQRRLRAKREGPETSVCLDCLAAQMIQHREEQVRTQRAALERIDRWVEECVSGMSPKSYLDAGALDAFMLLGLLREGHVDLAVGSLAPWRNSSVPLWMDEASIRSVFEGLYAAGWLVPAPGSLRDAFEVDQDSSVRLVEPLSVQWKLAPDSDGLPYDCLMDVLQAVLGAASPPELHHVWEWVCTNHVRATVAYYQNEYRFGGKCWGDALEANIKKLLDDCSVAQVRTLVCLSFKDLACLRQKGTRHPSHVNNMLPGSLLRKFDYMKSNGHTLRPAYRLRRDSEAIYTGLMFDTVLGGGDEFYANLTGQALQRAGKSGAEE